MGVRFERVERKTMFTFSIGTFKNGIICLVKHERIY